ncbi:hypothetical protein KW800_00105 [Candidatus Parcubacteria bacterium]|nr:hypothetical protein [Candidatus Parcubacteria bacterium]
MKKLIILSLVLVIVPQIAMAAWWNPFSWGIFHRAERANEAMITNAEKKADKPIPDAKPTASPLTGVAPHTVNFSIPLTKGFNYGGVYYTIAYGDGGAAGFDVCTTSCPQHLTLSHAYAAGTYTAVITLRTQCGSWECLGPSKEAARFNIVVSENTSVQAPIKTINKLSGVYNYSNGGLGFLIPQYHLGTHEVSHFITVTFRNQSEALKMLKIDVSKTCDKGLSTSIGGSTVDTIEVSGYDNEKAVKDWKEEVVFERVVSASAPVLSCATN